MQYGHCLNNDLPQSKYLAISKVPFGPTSDMRGPEFLKF
nr:MAG TPA: hypothetical protein [Caudoviricetes sp.]